MDAALNHLRATGADLKKEDLARLSPLSHKHFNMLGRYHFAVPEEVLGASSGRSACPRKLTKSCRSLSASFRSMVTGGPLKLIAWSVAEGLALETLPEDTAEEFYEEATRGRSASHHFRLKRPSRCSMTS